MTTGTTNIENLCINPNSQSVLTFNVHHAFNMTCASSMSSQTSTTTLIAQNLASFPPAYVSLENANRIRESNKKNSGSVMVTAATNNQQTVITHDKQL